MTDSSTGAQDLTKVAEQAISGAHDAVIAQIDEMIMHLQSIKVSIDAKKQAAVAGLKGFIQTADEGLQGVRTLKANIEQLIGNHLTNA